MAVTRKFLKGMGLTDEQVDTIIEAHTETVDGLKDKLSKAEAAASELEAVTKERDALKAGGDFKAKYEKEHKDFEDYKAGITAKETRAAKEKAVRDYLTGKNITGTNLEIAMRGLSSEIDAAELDGEKIKDTKPLDALIGGTFAGLVVSESQKGVDTSKPPVNKDNPAKEQSRAAALYQQYYNSRYGAQKGTEK